MEDLLAVTCRSTIGALLLIVLGSMSSSSALVAQDAPVVHVRAEWGTLGSGHLGEPETRRGVTILAGTEGPDMSLLLAGSHVPQGDVEPGWQAAALEFGRAWTPDPTFQVAVRMSGGAYRLILDNRHRVIAQCNATPGCMFEAPGFEAGWSLLGGVAGDATFTLHRGLGMSVGVRLERLLRGANRGEWALRWSAGLAYRIG